MGQEAARLNAALESLGREGHWPAALWLVRHGQSAGNVAADVAELAGADAISVNERDEAVPLSDLGQRQSRALGQWFGRLPVEQRPTVILTSPFLRTRQTASFVARAIENELGIVADERLRERALGVFDRLTRRGWTNRFPEQAALRSSLGKFKHRPPNGESWGDVVLRLQPFVEDLRLRDADARVLIVTHQAVILCLRYLLEGLDEAALVRVDAAGPVPNCSVTSYERRDGGLLGPELQLQLSSYVVPVDGHHPAVPK